MSQRRTVLLAFAAVILAVPLAVGHAQFHAMFALGVLMPACVLAWRAARPNVASIAPTVGMLSLGIAQLVESVGGLGYGPDNNGRVNGLAAIIDVQTATYPEEIRIDQPRQIKMRGMSLTAQLRNRRRSHG
jgi:hypothetical protein